jgi:hypothetical protein
MINKINPEKFNIRLILVLILGMAVFYLVIIFKFLIPDSFISLESTRLDSGVFVSADVIEYIEVTPIKRQKLKRKALEIIVSDKPYKIWLTDRFDRKSWSILIDPQIIGDTIKYNYVDRLLKEGILYNPMRLFINNSEIISLNGTKKEAKFALVFIILLLIGCLFFIYVFLKAYISKLLKYDIERIQRLIHSYNNSGDQ